MRRLSFYDVHPGVTWIEMVDCYLGSEEVWKTPECLVQPRRRRAGDVKKGLRRASMLQRRTKV